MPRQSTIHIDDPAAFGRRLREARTQAGLRLIDLQFEGCTMSYLSHLESGNRTPSLQIVRELASRLDVKETWLALGSRGTVAGTETLLQEGRLALRLDYPEAAEELFGRALMVARDDRDRAHALTGLAAHALNVGDLDRALKELETAVSLDPTLSRDLAVIELRGNAHVDRDDSLFAIAIYRQGLELASESHDRLGQSRFGVLLAQVLIANDCLDEAIAALGDVLGGVELGPHRVLAHGYWQQAGRSASDARPDDAHRYLDNAHTVLDAADHASQRREAQRLLAEIRTDAGDTKQALALIATARESSSPAGDPRAARLDLSEARAHARNDDPERAETLARRASHVLADREPIEVGRCLASIAAAYDRVKDPTRAQELYEDALAHLDRKETPQAATGVWASYGGLLERQGDATAALAAYKRAAGVREVTRRPQQRV